jgi:hypothetical protein
LLSNFYTTTIDFLPDDGPVRSETRRSVVFQKYYCESVTVVCVLINSEKIKNKKDDRNKFLGFAPHLRLHCARRCRFLYTRWSCVCVCMYICMCVCMMCSFAYDHNCIVNNTYHHAKAVLKHVFSSSIVLNALRRIRLSSVLLCTWWGHVTSKWICKHVRLFFIQEWPILTHFQAVFVTRP